MTAPVGIKVSQRELYAADIPVLTYRAPSNLHLLPTDHNHSRIRTMNDILAFPKAYVVGAFVKRMKLTETVRFVEVANQHDL